MSEWVKISQITPEEAIQALRSVDNEAEYGTEFYNACRLGAAIIEKTLIAKSPYPDGDDRVIACPYCGSGEYLNNPDEANNQYCGQCGQLIDWTEPEEEETDE